MSKWLVNAQGAVRSGWQVLGFYFFYAALTILVGLGIYLAHWQITESLSVWIGTGVGALVSWILVRREGRAFNSLGFMVDRRWVFDLFLGTLGGILLILVTALLVRGGQGFHWERTGGVGARQLLLGAWMFTGVAFNEEILFRGYPFQRLVEASGVRTGQLVIALLFVLSHWNNPGMQGITQMWATINIGLASILLGFCYLRTRSLALPIGVHLGWNWAQGSLLGFGVSGTTDAKGLWTPIFHGKPEWLTGGAFGLEASLPCTVVCGLAILLLWRWKGPAATRADASTALAS